MKKNLLFVIVVSVLLILLFDINAHSMGGSTMKKELIDLSSKFCLEKANKIVIETLDFITYKPHKKIDITDKKLLTLIVKELRLLEETDGIDTWCEYKMEFYDNSIKILELEFYDNPDLSFLRYRSEKEGIAKDYFIKKDLFNFLTLIRYQ